VNPHPKRDYIIALEIPEFTCLCPKTGQPDFATLHLQYVPDKNCVELKSLKQYIWSYRDEGAFHEDVTNAILNDLVAATKPRYMRLRARFYVRGGITTTVMAEHRRPGWAPPPPPPDYLPGWQESSRPHVSANDIEPPTVAPVTTAAKPDTRPAETHDTPASAAILGAPHAQAPPAKPRPARADVVYIGVDLGTTGCRAVAINDRGEMLARTQSPLPAPLKHGQQVTQDPTSWWNALGGSITALLAKIGPERVHALAIAGTSGTLLLCDERGYPVTPALMYNDSRAVSEAQAIANVASGCCGAQGPTSSLAKLKWLQHKSMAKTARHALHQADWVAGRLTGLWGQSDYHNCLKLGFDVENLQWPKWLAELEINTELLPRVHTPGEAIGTVSAESARTLGLPATTQIVAGTTDGVAEFLSVGGTAAGQGVTSLGSTLILKMVSERPIFAPQYGVYSHRLGNHWLAGGASNSGGKALLQYFDTAQMIEMTPHLDPENLTGLDYYPLPQVGERFPTNDPKRLPKLEPLPSDSITFFQGMLEGIARIEANGYHRLTQLGAPTLTQVLTTGAGSQNPAWQRIRQRIIGVAIKKARFGGAAYGSALLAAGMFAQTFAEVAHTASKN
jgi:7-cyano-7-deazaguanine reductase